MQEADRERDCHFETCLPAWADWRRHKTQGDFPPDPGSRIFLTDPIPPFHTTGTCLGFDRLLDLSLDIYTHTHAHKHTHTRTHASPKTTQAMPPPSIYVIGAQCTGKTTLVNALEAHFNGAYQPQDADKHDGWRPPTVVREVARRVLRDEGFETGDIRASPARALALQRRILAGQARAEAAATADAGAWLLADRSVLDPVVYARQYGGGPAAAAGLLRPPGETEAAAVVGEWPALRGRLARALVVVCEAGAAAWLADDGVRLMPVDGAEWRATHRAFLALLADLALPFVVLPCAVAALDARVAFVLERWEALRAAPTAPA